MPYVNYDWIIKKLDGTKNTYRTSVDIAKIYKCTPQTVRARVISTRQDISNSKIFGRDKIFKVKREDEHLFLDTIDSDSGSDTSLRE